MTMRLLLVVSLLAVGCRREKHPVKPPSTPVRIVPDSNATLEVTIDTLRGVLCYNWQGSDVLSCVKR